MALVQNIVEELETQNIKILLIINGHGGNFSLGPMVRQINRQDRKIKILILNHWEFISTTKTTHPEIHAGEGETSLMLSLFKEHVLPQKYKAANPFLQEKPYKQSDLNTFGIGRMASAGVWGDPTLATAAKGKKRIQEIKKNLLAFVKDRIQRLHEDPRYAGAGPLALRPMKPQDIPIGMKLKKEARWNQTQKDWKMILEVSSGGNFVALKNGEIAGTVTTITYSNLFSWIGMVLVDSKYRRSGIGNALLQEAIAYAQAKGTVYLDATPDGKKLYDTLGFKDECHLQRLQTHQLQIKEQKISHQCKPLTKQSLKDIFKKDRDVFGANRSALLQHLWKNMPTLAFTCYERNQLVGYCFGRAGESFTQIGPLVAQNTEIAKSLLLSALQKNLALQSFLIDTIDSQKEWSTFLQNIGFSLQRPFIRMYLGKAIQPKLVEQQFLIAGPELG